MVLCSPTLDNKSENSENEWLPSTDTPLKSHSHPDDRFFLHLPFHPKDPPRSALQAIFADTLETALQENDIGLERMTIAYSRAPNLGDLARRNRLGPAFNTKLTGH
jgi:hypothetical protein